MVTAAAFAVQICRIEFGDALQRAQVVDDYFPSPNVMISCSRNSFSVPLTWTEVRRRHSATST
jgi:hypothetical protein